MAKLKNCLHIYVNKKQIVDMKLVDIFYGIIMASF